MDKVCKPGYWVVVYHLQVTPTHTGDYQFAGYGDDFLVVRVNGKIVLDSGYYERVTDFQPSTVYPNLDAMASETDLWSIHGRQ